MIEGGVSCFSAVLVLRGWVRVFRSLGWGRLVWSVLGWLEEVNGWISINRV